MKENLDLLRRKLNIFYKKNKYLIEAEKKSFKEFNERDTCAKLIVPIFETNGFDLLNNSREEVRFVDNRSCGLYTEANIGKQYRADYVLYKDNKPFIVIEAKQASRKVEDGFLQSICYAEILKAPIAISTNGIIFIVFNLITGDIKITLRKNFMTYDELKQDFVNSFKNLDNVMNSNNNLDKKIKNKKDYPSNIILKDIFFLTLSILSAVLSETIPFFIIGLWIIFKKMKCLPMQIIAWIYICMGCVYYLEFIFNTTMTDFASLTLILSTIVVYNLLKDK